MSSAAILVLGAGHMGGSLIQGLCQHGYETSRLIAVDPDEKKLQALQQAHAISIATDATSVIQSADIILVAVKPQVFQTVLLPLRSNILKQKPLILSIAAGITTKAIATLFDETVPIVRAMPNMPAMVQCGATVFYATASVGKSLKTETKRILGAVGQVFEIQDESLMDVVTALSGSGPAYFFYLMAALQKEAVALGLPPELAQALTIETARGAAQLAKEKKTDFHTLTQRIMSPGGTTEAAINQLDSDHVGECLQRALKAAWHRSQALAL